MVKNIIERLKKKFNDLNRFPTVNLHFINEYSIIVKKIFYKLNY